MYIFFCGLYICKRNICFGWWFSIGSLGKDQQEPGVQNVTVKTVTFTGTQNGLRIKSWGRPSTGFARNILFQHAVMINVQNPIVIDQKYCPEKKGCPGQVRYQHNAIFFDKYSHHMIIHV